MPSRGLLRAEQRLLFPPYNAVIRPSNGSCRREASKDPVTSEVELHIVVLLLCRCFLVVAGSLVQFPLSSLFPFGGRARGVVVVVVVVLPASQQYYSSTKTSRGTSTSLRFLRRSERMESAHFQPQGGLEKVALLRNSPVRFPKPEIQ